MMSENSNIKISWQDNILSVYDDRLEIPRIKITYLEAFCRDQSHDRDWNETVMPHKTVLCSADDNGKKLSLESILSDGTVVSHVLTVEEDAVCFNLEAYNPSGTASGVHWGQPCIRVGAFSGLGDDDHTHRYDYIRQCFIFVDGQPVRMPLSEWSTEARYTPGQVWCPCHVPKSDVNPRPVSTVIPDNGLIGCFSKDERMILATAWYPYQELFQGVVQCIHSDFRIGGLAPGEKKKIRGKIYITENSLPELLSRYEQDFPEHQQIRSDKVRRRVCD